MIPHPTFSICVLKSLKLIWVWKFGIDSSLSIVPPVYAKPLPAIIGTIILKEDNKGARMKDILSPIPPVLCLSATNLSR